MIRLENVNKFYANNNVTSLGLVNVNLEFKRGEVVVITGESGSGKSTLLNVVTKVDKFDEGEIYYFGEETSYFGIEEMDQFRKDKVGFIFQNYNILESYTVLDNVMLPLLVNGKEKKEAKEEAIELLTKVGLDGRLKNKGSKLSGGEKQRCVIARALAMSSDILACDEPTGNLDKQTGDEIVKLIKEVSDNKLVLIVTHNYEQFKDIATRKIRIHDGQVVEDTVIKEPKEEIEEKLELNTVDAKKSVDYKIALKNLRNTPMKTLLSSVIFLFICIFFLFLSSYIFSQMNTSAFSSEFGYLGTNKMVIYNSNNKPFSKFKYNNFQGEKLINQFYYTTSLNAYNAYNDTSYRLYYEPNPSKLSEKTLYSGRLPKEDDELVLLVSNYFYQKPTELEINSKIFKVVGIQKRDDINQNYDGNDIVVATGNDKLKQIFLAEKIFAYTSTIFTYDLDNVTSVSSDFEDKDIYLNNYNLFNTSELTKSTETGNSITIGYDFENYVNKHIYEITVYGNKTVNKVISFFNNAKAIDVYSQNFGNPMLVFVMKIASYITVGAVALYLIGIYFLTYALVGKLYDSKIKDFSILRTVGITKKDMARILRLDIMLQMLIMQILVLVTFIILSNVVKSVELSRIFRPDIGVVLIYLVLMNLISFLLSRKIHKRIYQKTVGQSLGGTKND